MGSPHRGSHEVHTHGGAGRVCRLRSSGRCRRPDRAGVETHPPLRRCAAAALRAGRHNGIQVGQEFFVRRLQKERDQVVSRETPGTVRTTGWIRVYAVDDEMSLVTIQYACDSVEPGDYLEPFAVPTALPRAPKMGKPEKGNYA